MNASPQNPSRGLLLRHNLKALKLPTMLSEHEKLAREAADANEDYQGYLLRLSELELTRPDWIDRHETACFVGNSGTGKSHLATAVALCAARSGKRVKFTTAATLANHLEEMQKKYQLERVLKQLDRIDLLVIDELGYLSFSRTAAELLFQVFADRYERGSILVTSNLPFDEWTSMFQGERMTAALLDRFTHRCTIIEMNGESYRFRESTTASTTARKQKNETLPPSETTVN